MTNQSSRFFDALSRQLDQMRADADTAGMRARIARLERDRHAALLALNAAIAMLDEYESEAGDDE